MRTLLSAALVSALAVFAPALPATAAETRLTADEIRDIARRELLWCEEYSAQTDDCQVITLIRLMPDGSLAETSTQLISERPSLQVYIADTDRLEGDRVCSKVEADKTRFAFTIDGQAAPETTTLGLRMLFVAQLEEFDGKTFCQAFFRGEDPNIIREEITVDGERRTDLESTYHLREGTSALKLRPQITEDEQNGQVTI